MTDDLKATAERVVAEWRRQDEQDGAKEPSLRGLVLSITAALKAEREAAAVAAEEAVRNLGHVNFTSEGGLVAATNRAYVARTAADAVRGRP